MPSLPDDPTKRKMTAPTHHSIRPGFPNSVEATQIDTDQMFYLIDGVLPFEACLYHQVLPLALEGSVLRLGMVDPEDTAALDYFRRILAYLNCSLVPQPITSELHQSMLSSYLNRTRSNQTSQHTANASKRSTESPADPPHWKSRKSNPADRQTQPTLIVDSPENLDLTEEVSIPPSPELIETPTIEQELTPPADSSSSTPVTEEMPPVVPVAPVANVLPQLETQSKYLSSPVEVLATLPPQELLKELLGRVIVGGIGRLYFERHPDRGRILWSLNGVLQSVLDGLTPAVFQGVINELKLMTHLPLITVSHPKQVEIERLHRQSRLLLRLRVMPGKHGEEATLQILRGAALKFYQQQQLANLGRDALTMAQQLQQKLNEMRDRARANPSLTSKQLEALPALNEMLKHLDQQLKDLEGLQQHHNEES